MTEQLLRPVAGHAQRRRTLAAAPAPPAAALVAAPAAPARAWPVCAVTLAAWAAIVALHLFALHRDALRSAAAARVPELLIALVPPVLVFALASCALAVALVRAAESLLRPRALLLLAPAFCGAALALAVAATGLAKAAAAGAPLSDFMAQLARLDAFDWWVDACLAILAFLSQLAFAAWRRARQQARAAEQARADGLALRLRLLQGQLKPHFLFNALNSISALVRTAERALAAQALGQLSELLRHVVHASRHEWLSVADEMAFIDAYLDLQLLRYGERLAVELDIGAGDWRAIACPPLLFQPLVENAIHHGVEQHLRQCTLRIRLERAGGAVVFAVDNPLAPAGLARAGHGIGLRATRERLAILYGPDAALAGSDDGAVYRATLTFPERALNAS